jgi:hypothetical protein
MINCEKGDAMLMKRIADTVCVVALSSLCFSSPQTARATPGDGASAPREHADIQTKRQGMDVKVLSEARTDDGTFRVLSVRHGEQGWLEITKTSPDGTKATTLFQDTVIFTNERNDGGASVPLEVKRKLAAGYAKHVVSGEGGVEAFSQSLTKYEAFGVPLPAGLYREALENMGVRLP